MAEKSKHGFIILMDFYEPLRCLTDAQKGQVFDACFIYHQGNEPTFEDPFVKMAFSFLRPFFDRQKQAYEDKCAKNRANALRKYEDKQTDANASDCKRTDADGCDGSQIKVKSESESKAKAEIKDNEEKMSNDISPRSAEQGDGDEKDNDLKCPQTELYALYEEMLPELPKLPELRESTKRNVRARWREKLKKGKFSTKDGGIVYFRGLFAYIQTVDWVMGRTGRSTWRCDYDWIMQAKHFDRITSGYYERSTI